MKYTKEQLYQINVYALRNLAREVGVKAPTTLNKQALMDAIIQIESGKKQPCTPTKRGRPLKNGFENKNSENEKSFLGSNSASIKTKMKKEFIACILKEIERKLNELL